MCMGVCTDVCECVCVCVCADVCVCVFDYTDISQNLLTKCSLKLFIVFKSKNITNDDGSSESTAST